MKILLITPLIPYPLTEGGKISQYAVIDRLRKYTSITLCFPVYEQIELSWAKALKKEWLDVNVVVINLIKAETVKDKIRSIGSKVLNKTFRDHAEKQSFLEVENPSFNRIYNYHTESLISKLNLVVEEIKPDLIQIDHLPFIDLVLALPGNIKKVFVHHELRFARLTLNINVNRQEAGLYEQYLLNSVKVQEISLLNFYDAIVVFSELDAQKLRKELPFKNILVDPFPVLDNNFIKIERKNLDIQRLVFVGNDQHAPNGEAVDWYLSEMAKDVNLELKLKLHLVGNWTTRFKNKYKNNETVIFAGFVEDLAEFCKNSVLIVPLKVGSGIRTKIIYAMAQGIPIISTSIGVEGIPVSDKNEIMIANSKKEFLEAIRFIKNNVDFTLAMVSNAQKIAFELYSQERSALSRKSFFEKIIQTENA